MLLILLYKIIINAENNKDSL